MDRPSVRYGESELSFDLPAGVVVTCCTPRAVVAAADPLAVVATALDAPVEAAPLDEAARGAGRVVVVLSGGGQPADAQVLLMPVIARLARAGLGPEQISIVLARGLDPAAPRSDVQRFLGAAVMDSIRTVQSAPDTPEMNLPVVHDEEVGEVRVHRLAAEADLVVLVGTVAPDPLLGFTGGADILVPGVAERGTVLAAHRLALRASVRPDGAFVSFAGQLERTPFCRAAVRISRAHGRTWLLAAIPAGGGGIAAAVAGEVGAAHEVAARTWRHLDGTPSGESRGDADLVVAGGAPPFARDLLRGYETLVAADRYARPGAPIVWASRAVAGVGPASFLSSFQIRKPSDHLATLRREFHPHGLTAYALRSIAKARPVHVVSEAGRDLLRPMGLLPFTSIEKAVEHACKHHDVKTCTVLPSPTA